MVGEEGKGFGDILSRWMPNGSWSHRNASVTTNGSSKMGPLSNQRILQLAGHTRSSVAQSSEPQPAGFRPILMGLGQLIKILCEA